ncbi:MAG: ATP-grasp domain-containing protein [Myxococcota bacterium]
MSAAPKILVVGCGFPQLGLVRFCRAEDLVVVGLDMNPEAVGFSACHFRVLASTTDVEAIVAAAREHRVDGITTCGSEHALLSTATACEALDLPFYGSPATIRRCQAKDEMRAAFAAAGVPSPAYELVESRTRAEAFAARVGLPVVVKPARGWGQRGVAIARREEELAAAVAHAIEAAHRAGRTEGPVCLLEDYIEGREFSVDAYTKDGTTEVLAVTERIITGYPDPPGITYAEVFPCQSESIAQIVEVAERGLAALGITRGPTYTQMRAGPKGAFIVETAYRLGGGLDPDVALLASGISLYRRIVGVALGREDWESYGREAPAHGGATGRFLVTYPGTITSVSGLEEARGMPGVVAAEVYPSVGDTVHPLTDGSRRVGHVLAFGESREEAETRAQRAMETIRITTTDNRGRSQIGPRPMVMR